MFNVTEFDASAHYADVYTSMYTESYVNDSTEIIASVSNSSSRFKTTIYTSYLIISIIGIIGNGITILLTMRSSRLRKPRVYVLMVNQSLADMFTCLVALLWIGTDLYVSVGSGRGSGAWLHCVFVRSQFMIAFTTCVSSYNLGLISAERCYSILAPIRHRLRCTKVRLAYASLVVWVYGCALMMAYAFPTNGARPNGAGCYNWDRFPSGEVARLFSVAVLLGFNGVPITIMVVSYTLIYVSVAGKKGVKDHLKMNVIKMLATCVLVYIVCHSFRSMIGVLSRFRGYSLGSTSFLVG